VNEDEVEIARVTHFMKGVARAMERNAVLDAPAVWTRIQLAERQRLAERARRPAYLAWMFAKCWCTCCVALFVYLIWPVIGSYLLAAPMYAYVAIAAGATILVLGRKSLKG
jgi:hypothetical protein